MSDTSRKRPPVKAIAPEQAVSTVVVVDNTGPMAPRRPKIEAALWEQARPRRSDRPWIPSAPEYFVG
jgi:hypothetical protein